MSKRGVAARAKLVHGADFAASAPCPLCVNRPAGAAGQFDADHDSPRCEGKPGGNPSVREPDTPCPCRRLDTHAIKVACSNCNPARAVHAGGAGAPTSSSGSTKWWPRGARSSAVANAVPWRGVHVAVCHPHRLFKTCMTAEDGRDQVTGTFRWRVRSSAGRHRQRPSHLQTPWRWKTPKCA